MFATVRQFFPGRLKMEKRQASQAIQLAERMIKNESDYF